MNATTLAKAGTRTGTGSGEEPASGAASINAEDPFPRFKEGLAYQAQLLARFTQNDYLARIAGTGIAPAQAYVLGELWFHAPLSQVELARRLDIGKATVGQTLARLERSGLVERLRMGTDRRRIMVHLTEKGRALREPLRIAAIEQETVLAGLLGEAEARELGHALQRVNELFSAVMLRSPSD